MTGLTMGVVGTARKENELRAPIDPVHIAHIEPELRRRIWFETGYGERFGVRDSEIDSLAAGLLGRDLLFERCDIVVLAKPTEEDFPGLREGQILWGWPHCVQGEAITQLAIDRRLTLIAWEAMNLWSEGEVRGLHVFHKNNEIAGYAGVLHATQLCGTTGLYGPAQRAAVIHSGLTARGALHALKGLGYSDLTCFTVLQDHELGAQIPGVRYKRLVQAEEGPETFVMEEGGALVPMADELAEYDLIVNCVFQDTDRPMMFARGKDLSRFRRSALIVDVSCDAGLGFDFARPTTFEEPMFEAGAGVLYYAVDHTPSLLWRSATFEISRALLPYLATVLSGPEAWAADTTIRRAIEIREGRVLNPKILTFQNRAEESPHAKLS
ncbi:MAG: N(5)-(carboxyethyl)ornithine synthase [Planctomycetota bacterium]|jgi:alanine dehydrogenase